MEKAANEITIDSEFSKGTDGQFHGWKIQRVPGQLRGIRQFRFAKVMKYPNGSEFYNYDSTNVIELRNLLKLLEKIKADGLLEDTYTEEEL